MSRNLTVVRNVMPMLMWYDRKLDCWIRDSGVWWKYSNEPYDIVIISGDIAVNVLEQ